MLKKSKGNRFHQQGFIFSTFPINFIICLTPYRKASITGAFFIKESEDDMGVRVVFPDMGKDPSIQLIEKTITENGTYDALTDGANGYSKVNVNVEGGGGESDFSIANVTLINNASDAFQLIMPRIFGNKMYAFTDYEDFESGDVLQVPLYKGSIEGFILNSDANLRMTGVGNVITSVKGVLIGITGDCTITIS